MSERRLNIERSAEHREGEPGREVPIIDIIRHGDTNYEEFNPNFKFDPTAPDFKLDAEHLDLTEQGIENITQTANDLMGKIDKDKEIILLYASPNYRAQSSALLIADALRKNGIQILGSNDGRILSTLKQIELKDQSIKGVWAAEYKKFLTEDPAHATLPMMKAHREVASRLGITPQEAWGDNYQKVKENFENFIRHMANIRQSLSPETQASLGNKRIRVVAVTHEELPAQLLDETLGYGQTLLRGQIMELRPEGLIENTGQPVKVKAILYPKGDQREEVRRDLKVSFKEDKKKEGASH